MKKTLAILIALAMVVSAASAQVAVKGSVKLGGIWSTSSDLAIYDDSGLFRMSQDNVSNAKFDVTDQTNTKQQVNVQFTYANGPAGLKINMRSEDFGNFGTNVAYVYLDMFEKKVKMLYGLTEDNTFRVGTYIQPDIDGKNNLAFIITPVTGLTFGLDVELPLAGAAKLTTTTNTYTTEQLLYQIGVGVKYTNDMFSVTAAYKGDKAGANTFTTHSETAYVGASYLGIKKLTLNTYVAFYDMLKEDGMYMQTETALGYMITDVLKVGTFVGSDGLSKAEKDADVAKAELWFLPYVNYSLNPSTMLVLEGYYSLNEDNADSITDMYVEPRVTYTVNDNAKITGFVNYYVNDFSDEVAKIAVTSIGVDFLYTF